jgi:hypothetical protein
VELSGRIQSVVNGIALGAVWGQVEFLHHGSGICVCIYDILYVFLGG